MGHHDLKESGNYLWNTSGSLTYTTASSAPQLSPACPMG